MALDLLDAAREGELSVVEEFFKQENASAVYLTVKNEDTQATPLHNAAANGHLEVLEYILKNLDSSVLEQAVNAQNYSGNTPLHWGALTGSLDAVKLLVQAGADAMIKNQAGFDAIYQAEAAEKEEVVDYLLENFDVAPELTTEPIEEANEEPIEDVTEEPETEA